MDVRRSINTGIWSDPFVENLDPMHKLVWLYLLTNQHTNMIGIYQMSTRRICFETGLDNETVRKAFEAFQRLSKAFVIILKNSSEWVFLPNWVKNQSMNTNMLKAASKQFDSLPNELIDKLLMNHYETLRKALKGLGNPSENMKLKLKLKDEIESEIEAEVDTSVKDFPFDEKTDSSLPKDKKKRTPRSSAAPPLNFPFKGEKFTGLWAKLMTSKKWAKKTDSALQMSLDKLAKYDEEFACLLISDAVEKDWQGVVYDDTPEKYRKWKQTYGGTNSMANPELVRTGQVLHTTTENQQKIIDKMYERNGLKRDDKQAGKT